MTVPTILPLQLRALLSLAVVTATVSAAPPFNGTIYIDPDIITAADPTTFQSVSYTGQGMRRMFDRRVNSLVDLNAYLFTINFSDGLTAEIQVNPEFSTPAAARVQAVKYGAAIGRLPAALRASVKVVWIHKGGQLFGGGSNMLLIHTDQAALYDKDGILEETLAHEAAHTSLDGAHASATGWLAAQTADGEFISTYARDNPAREDVAESFLPYLAIRLRPQRITPSDRDKIAATIPNRISYFDQQKFNLYPMAPAPPPDPTPAVPASLPATQPSGEPQITARESLRAKLSGTRWSWPDRSFGGRAYYILNADGTVSAGWHNRIGWWTVEGENTIAAQIGATPGAIQVHFDPDLRKGYLRSPGGQPTERQEQSGR